MKGKKRPRTARQMTILEAERILDIVSTALQRESQHSYHPISLLKGYSGFPISGVQHPF